MSLRALAIPAVTLACMLSFGVAQADTALSVSCAGTPAATSITWAATTSGGISPVSLLWSNGSTSSTQTLSVGPGAYSMNIQATDASSSIATSTCAATMLGAAPTISSFIATPSVITIGQSATLSWNVANASSTSLDNGVGAVSSTSIVVTPSTSTTYTLSAANPGGTTTAQASIVVNATSTSSTPSTIQAQIQALLQQIAQLQQQLRNLLLGQSGTATSTPPTIVPPGQIGKGTCIALNRNLGEGDDGDDVMQLQQMLASDPQSGFSVAPTGYFGPLTARAMIRFQETNGIASSSQTNGSVGPLTRGFFQRHCGEGLGKEDGSSSVLQASSSLQNQIMLPANFGEDRGQGKGHGNGNGRDN